MNILLIGKNGQVGWELQRSLATYSNRFLALARPQLDVEDTAHLAQNLRQLIGSFPFTTNTPLFIINATAYTNVDKAEQPEEAAKLAAVNVLAPQIMAQIAKEYGAFLLHFSTDYVFDGTKSSPYHEDDLPTPLSCYGKSKWQGEQAITASGCNHLILRTSWVYSIAGQNFALAILRRARQHSQLQVINDSFGTPTSAEFLADSVAYLCQHLADNSHITDFSTPHPLSGTYHLVCKGYTSWHGYATALLEQAIAQKLVLQAAPQNIAAISTANFALNVKQPYAPRPTNSCMDTRRIEEHFKLHIPPWPFYVARFVRHLALQSQLDT